MTTYRIKKWPSTFNDLWTRYEPMPMPCGDETYVPGDTLVIDEYIAGRPTGRVVYAKVLFPMPSGVECAVKVFDRHYV